MSLYPQFLPFQILKAEMLESLRDTPRHFINIIYQEYPDGIISGFRISIDNENEKLIISPGILKKGSNIYLLESEQEMELHNEKNIVYMEIIEEPSINGIEFSFSITNHEEEMEDKIELFRYYRSKNTPIRIPEDWKSIYKEATGTINYTKSHKSIRGGKTLPDEIFKIFGKELLNRKPQQPEDILFAYSCLNDSISFSVLEQYFSFNGNCSNEVLLQRMNDKLESIGKDKSPTPSADVPQKAAPPKIIIS